MEDVLKIGDLIDVKVMEIDNKGRVNVSAKALLPRPHREPGQETDQRHGNRDGRRDSHSRSDRRDRPGATAARRKTGGTASLNQRLRLQESAGAAPVTAAPGRSRNRAAQPVIAAEGSEYAQGPVTVIRTGPFRRKAEGMRFSQNT